MTNSNTSSTVSAPTTDTMRVRPPAASLMAVRELDPLTAKPWLSALAMLAAPMPMNSWLASTL
ncbi:hypothetical protein D9M68_485200 [compost metagenome]